MGFPPRNLTFDTLKDLPKGRKAPPVKLQPQLQLPRRQIAQQGGEHLDRVGLGQILLRVSFPQLSYCFGCWVLAGPWGALVTLTLLVIIAGVGDHYG